MKNNAYFHLTQSLICLGSVITACLRDSTDGEAHIRNVYGTMGALIEFFSNRAVSLNIKLNLYLTTPLNTVLWG
jgi:hypothetical protein